MEIFSLGDFISSLDGVFPYVRLTDRDISAILLNCGVISLRRSGREMTQPPRVPDAGSCYGASDRHQLSMPNSYSKENVDAGWGPNTDESKNTKQNA